MLDDHWVLNRFKCHECRGTCCEQEDDAVFNDIEIECTPTSEINRGRVGENYGNSFSGVIDLQPEEAHRFRQELEAGQIRQ